MTFKKKTAPEVLPTPELPQAKVWKFEDGVTADTPDDIRSQWFAEYKRRQKEVLPPSHAKEALFKQVN